MSPSWTVSPSLALTSVTVPARGASTGISIFMDSSTMIASPAPHFVARPGQHLEDHAG